jgi:hypothetical protein
MQGVGQLHISCGDGEVEDIAASATIVLPVPIAWCKRRVQGWGVRRILV